MQELQGRVSDVIEATYLSAGLWRKMIDCD
jgi:hypothetical protein